MEFPNAANGVKKIFTAEILGLVASLFTIPLMVLSVLSAPWLKTVSSSSLAENVTALAMVVGIVACGLIAAVFAVISYLLNIVGVSRAAKDEAAFKIALFAILAALVATMTASFFNAPGMNNTFVSTSCYAISDIAELCITLYIIQGIRNLAERLHDTAMIDRGNTIFKVIMVSVLLNLTAKIISLFFGSGSALITVCLLLVSGLLDFIQYVLFLIYLSKAKKMLKA